MCDLGYICCHDISGVFMHKLKSTRLYIIEIDVLVGENDKPKESASMKLNLYTKLCFIISAGCHFPFHLKS